VCPEESGRAIGEDKCTEPRADIKCTYKCNDWDDDHCDCKCTGQMMRISNNFDLYQTSAIMTQKQFGTYQMVC